MRIVYLPTVDDRPFPGRKVWDKEGVVIIPDHYIFTADPRANRNVDILRDFVDQQARLGYSHRSTLFMLAL